MPPWIPGLILSTNPLILEGKRPASGPLKSVQVDALVVLKICKHASSAHPQVITGQLLGIAAPVRISKFFNSDSILGMDVEGELQVTNSFPFPSADPSMSSNDLDSSSASAAASAPRSKASTWYQTEMVRCLREMNVDANSVGWYQSANLGNFVGSKPSTLVGECELIGSNS